MSSLTTSPTDIIHQQQTRIIMLKMGYRNQRQSQTPHFLFTEQFAIRKQNNSLSRERIYAGFDNVTANNNLPAYALPPALKVPTLSIHTTSNNVKIGVPSQYLQKLNSSDSIRLMHTVVNHLTLKLSLQLKLMSGSLIYRHTHIPHIYLS